MKNKIKQYHLNKVEALAYKCGWNLAASHKRNNYGSQIDKAKKNSKNYTYYMWYVAGYEDYVTND